MTREEAIKIIKSATVYTPEEMEALETIIPELREREDERIRTALCDIVRDMPYMETELRAHGLTIEQALDYLEKQKINTDGDFARGYDCGYECCLNSHGAEWFEKQKDNKFAPRVLPCSAAWFKDGEEKQKEPHYAKRNALFDKCVENCDPEVMKEVSDEIDEMLGKEQKPAEWSEEDERMLSRCVKSIETSKQFADSDTFKLAKDKEIVWLENRFKFLGPQPKQELSEEEFEAFRKTLAKDAFLDEITSKRVAKKLLNSVKSLRPFWKPTECQMDSLKEIADSLPKGSNLEYLEEVIHGLDILMNEYPSYKSIQENNWKPSEEQMSILKAVKEDVGRGSGYWGEGLGSLIKDLEKL